MSTRSLNVPGASATSEIDVSGRVKNGLDLIGRVAGVSGAEGLVTYVLLGLMALVVAWSVQLAGWGDSPVLIWTVLAGAAPAPMLGHAGLFVAGMALLLVGATSLIARRQRR